MKTSVTPWKNLLGFDDIVIGRKQLTVRKVTEAEVDAVGRLSGKLNVSSSTPSIGLMTRQRTAVMRLPSG